MILSMTRLSPASTGRFASASLAGRRRSVLFRPAAGRAKILMLGAVITMPILFRFRGGDGCWSSARRAGGAGAWLGRLCRFFAAMLSAYHHDHGHPANMLGRACRRAIGERRDLSLLPAWATDHFSMISLLLSVEMRQTRERAAYRSAPHRDVACIRRRSATAVGGAADARSIPVRLAPSSTGGPATSSLATSGYRLG